MRATIVEPYDVLLLKLHTEERCACVAREIRTYTRKKRNKNSFYNKDGWATNKKNTFCLAPSSTFIYFFSLGPLFIRDRLKYCVCKLGAFKQTFILHIEEALVPGCVIFSWEFLLPLPSQRFYPLWKGDRGKFSCIHTFTFPIHIVHMGNFRFHLQTLHVFMWLFPLQWTGKNIANYHVVLDIQIRH